MKLVRWFPFLVIALVFGCTETEPVAPTLDDAHA